MKQSNNEVLRLIDELKQDISFELIEQSGWELRKAYETILTRLEDIRAVAEESRGPEPLVHCGGTICTAAKTASYLCRGHRRTDLSGEAGRSETTGKGDKKC